MQQVSKFWCQNLQSGCHGALPQQNAHPPGQHNDRTHRRGMRHYGVQWQAGRQERRIRHKDESRVAQTV